MNTTTNSPARTYAGLFGAVLLLVGIAGFFVEPSFSGDERGSLLIFDVNGVHNLVHIASGVLGLLAYRAGENSSRQYAIGFGVVYLLVTIWGFMLGDGEAILGILPINTEDNFLHLAIALAGIAAGLASRERGDTTAARTA